MADERLRLTAEVTDGFSGPLGKLEGALNRAARTGSQAGKDLKKDFDGFHGVLGKSTSALQSMAAPLAALGVAGLGVGLSLTTMGSALRSFSSGTQQLSILSKETGLAVDQLRAFGSLGERFGVSAETMQGGARKFSEEMSRLRKRYGETYSSLQAMNLGDLVEKLVAAPNMKAALDAAMDTLSNIGDPVKRRKVAEQLFGGDQIGAIAGQLPGRVSEVLAEIEQRQGRTTDAQVKAAQRFEQTLSELREGMDSLRTGALTPLLEAFNTFLATLNSPEALKVIKAEIEGLKNLVASTVAEFNKLDKLGDSLKGGKFDLKGNTDRELATIARVFEALKNSLGIGGPTVQQQSFGGGGFGGATIQRAGYSTGAGGYRGPLPGTGGFGGPLPTMGGGYGGGGAGVLRGGTGSGPLGTPRMSPLAPPGPMGDGSSVSANPGAYKAVLDHIAESEGTANRRGGGYNTSLGYGRYLPGGQEQTLTDKSLNEILALGSHMRRQPGNPNSSALGRYQIVGQTLRGLMRKMRLSGDEKFDERLQDRMGAELARARGSSPSGLGQEWASLRGRRLSRAVELMREVDPSASTMPGTRVAEAPSGERPGDKVMRRFYGDEAPSAKGGAGGGKGSLDITLHGFPAGTKPRASMDDLFKEVNVGKSRQMDTTSL